MHQLGFFEEAMDAYDKGLEIDPSNAAMIKSMEEAKTSFKEAESVKGLSASPEKKE